MKKNELYEELKRQILTLKLSPGESMEEVNLCNEYNISRTPLREILQKLAGEGYVELVKNRGATVSSMDYKTLRNFFATAPMMYSAVGRLAAKNATQSQIKELQKAQANFIKANKKKDIDGMSLYNNRFHRLIGEMANNDYLMPSYDRLLIDHARIGQTFFHAISKEMLKDLKEVSKHHDKMIQCIIEGDSEGMVILTQEHWRLAKGHLEMYVGPDPLPDSMSEE